MKKFHDSLASREKWLTETISLLEQVIDADNLLCNEGMRRILREYQDELKALKEKGKENPLNPANVASP